MDHHVFLVIAVLILMPKEGEAVFCYLCAWSNTGSNPLIDSCRPENFDPSKIKVQNCNQGCMKSIMTESNETTVYTRNCADRSVHKNECTSAEVAQISHQDCFCKEDYCNAASFNGLGLAQLTIGLLVIALYTLFIGEDVSW